MTATSSTIFQRPRSPSEWPLAQLEVVVGEPDRRAPERDEEDRERLGRVLGEREEGKHRRADDQEAAHRRRPLLHDMGCGAFRPDLLPEISRAEDFDELRPDDDGCDHREQAGDQDWDHVRAIFVISAGMPSSPTAREALTSTASPGRRKLLAASTASLSSAAQVAGS